MKTVSVVMCTYNGEVFLREQLDSIVTQTHPIHELIIQDDCSTDHTAEIVTEYAQRYPYIRFHRNTQNLGFNRNFQDALSKATGDFVAIADQDDIWYPEKIQKQAETIGGHDICISAYHTGSTYRTDGSMQTVTPCYELSYLLFYDSTPGHSMLIRRDFLQDVFAQWDGHIVYDWWLSVNAHLGRGIVCVDRPLNWHRPHNASAMTRLKERYASHIPPKPTWQPYVYGIRKYREQQLLPTWKFFYGYIERRTSDPKFALPHALCHLMLKRDVLSFLRLCRLCMKYKQHIYFYPRQKGIASYVRAFFYPAIRAYGNTYFYL